jgi:hypothetical protein
MLPCFAVSLPEAYVLRRKDMGSFSLFVCLFVCLLDSVDNPSSPQEVAPNPV